MHCLAEVYPLLPILDMHLWLGGVDSLYKVNPSYNHPKVSSLLLCQLYDTSFHKNTM